MSILLGRYQILEKLGEGGMAEVYRALQLNLDREVAIKFIKRDFTDDMFAARFEREAKAIARLSHPNIIQVYDFDRAEDGRYFMVMELLSGSDLASLLRLMTQQEKRLSLQEVMDVTRRAADALFYAHQQGIVHRDVKPSNIFLTANQHVKVVDFGVAKVISEGQLTYTGMTIGTPHYFAPEQGYGKPVDHRVDIYALGVVFYELLTGQVPYDADSTLSIIAQHANAPIPDPREIRPDLPYHVRDIVQKAMAKNPDDRYQTMQILMTDLDRLARESGPTLIVEDNEATRIESGPVIARTQKRTGLIAILAAVLVVTAVAAFLLLTADSDSEEEEAGEKEPTAIELGFAPAAENEYLVLVANVKGDEAAGVNVTRYLSNALGTGDLAVLLGNRFRLENVAQEIDSREDAAALAEQANATLIVWGVMDAAALEVTIQANGYPEGAVDRAGFTLPRDENFAARLVDSVPAGVSIYSQIMMLNRMMQQGDGVVMVGLLLNWSEETVNLGEKIVPSTPLDGYLLEITQAFVAKEYEQADAATTNALAIAPNDITLYNWRYVINGMFLRRNERAQADIQKLYELMPDNPMPVFDDMLLAYINSNHEEVLRITADVPWDNTNQINFITLLYRIMAIYSLGDFETALEETNRWISLTEGMDIRQTIISMEPMRALIYETLGDEEAAETDKVFARSNRGLDMTTQSLNLFPPDSIPPVLMLFGGYLNEVNNNTTFAAFAYQAGLNAAPDDYLLNWRLAVLSEQQGNDAVAYQHYIAALENALVPFPIASYQLALLSQEYDTETDACELLAQAEEDANTNLNLYALLLEKISTAQSDFQCE